MRKFALLVSFFFTTQLTVNSQPRLNDSACLPEGITFNTQAQIDSFQIYYPDCTEIEGDVTISGNNISNLNGLNMLTLFGGDLIISYNDSLANFIGLNNLTSIEGDFKIETNLFLTSLTGLESLGVIRGNLFIGGSFTGNYSLISLSGLDNLTSIGGNLYIWQNDGLASLTGLESLNTIGNNLWFFSVDNLANLTGLENLAFIGGSLRIGGDYYGGGGNSSLIDLTGLCNLSSVSVDIEILRNPSLSSLSGLENLTSIGGNLIIGGIGSTLWGGLYGNGNPALTSLSGLNNLSSIGGGLMIVNNDSLSSITGLENLISIDGDLCIGDVYANFIVGNASLPNLTGLENLTSIGGDLKIYRNDTLSSLTGLDNIDAGSIENLDIRYNGFLSACEVQCVCDYLASPNGTIQIYENATGCNSPEEVQETCDSISSVKEIIPIGLFKISPNPLISNTTIEYSLSQDSQVSLQILDLSGQVIVTLVNEFQNYGNHKILFKGNGLIPGIYFCMLETNERIQITKMIKL